jgi:hypothetical protein
MNRLIGTCRLFFSVFLLASYAAGAQIPNGTPACHWSSPQLLESTKAAAFAMTDPVLTTTRAGDIYVAGRGPNVMTDTGDLTVQFPIVVYRIDRRGARTRLPTPAFNGVYAYPRLAVDDNAVHLFWGEPNSGDTSPRPRTVYPSGIQLETSKSIWTSTYVGGTWSPPRHVASSSTFQMMHLQQWNASSRSSPIQIPIPTGWLIRWFGVTGPASLPDVSLGDTYPLYPAILRPTPSQLLLGFIMNDRRNRGGINGVYAVRSTDTGRTMSAPIRIASAGSGGTRDLLMVQTPDGRVHAIWGAMANAGAFDAQRIGYASSRDTGKTWSAPSYYDPRQEFRHPQVVADRNNRIHLIYEVTVSGGQEHLPALFYTSRSTDRDWNAPIRLFDDTLSTFTPVMTATDRGDLVVLFTEQIGTRGKFPWYASAISYLRPGRDCMPSS